MVLDFDQTWDMMTALQKWMGVLGDIILDLMKSLPLSARDQLQDRIAMYIKNFERKDENMK